MLPQATMVPVEHLTPADWNPRLISDDRFGNLCRSIQHDPEFLLIRPILATMDGTIFAGNMRYRACVHLGWREVPAIQVAISEAEAKRRALVDNRNWGEWDSQMLAEIVYNLHLDGDDISTLGFSEREVQELLGSVSGLGDEREPKIPPSRCPTCHQPIFDVDQEAR
jgi:ParB-like chromosome segregation protein Spo0J